MIMPLKSGRIENVGQTLIFSQKNSHVEIKQKCCLFGTLTRDPSVTS